MMSQSCRASARAARYTRFVLSMADLRASLDFAKVVNHNNHDHVQPRRKMQLAPGVRISPTACFRESERIIIGLAPVSATGAPCGPETRWAASTSAASAHSAWGLRHGVQLRDAPWVHRLPEVGTEGADMKVLVGAEKLWARGALGTVQVEV